MSILTNTGGEPTKIVANVITFECNYICPPLGFVGRNFANVITFAQKLLHLYKCNYIQP